MSTNLQFFPMLYLRNSQKKCRHYVYIMIKIRSGFLLTPIRMTLNDLERPIHLKVRLADGTLDVRMLWLSDLTMKDRIALFSVRSNPSWRPAAILKILNGHISATRYPLHYTYVHRPYTLPSAFLQLLRFDYSQVVQHLRLWCSVHCALS